MMIILPSASRWRNCKVRQRHKRLHGRRRPCSLTLVFLLWLARRRCAWCPERNSLRRYDLSKTWPFAMGSSCWISSRTCAPILWRCVMLTCSPAVAASDVYRASSERRGTSEAHNGGLVRTAKGVRKDKDSRSASPHVPSAGPAGVAPRSFPAPIAQALSLASLAVRGRRCCKRFDDSDTLRSARRSGLWNGDRVCGPSSATVSIPRAGTSSRSGMECSGTIHLHAQDEHHGSRSSFMRKKFSQPEGGRQCPAKAGAAAEVLNDHLMVGEGFVGAPNIRDLRSRLS
jgi:hypothetical protein